MRRKKIIKTTSIVLCIIFILCLAGILGFNQMVKIQPPKVKDTFVKSLIRVKSAKDNYQIGKNWLKKDSSGLWEMYVEGKPYERGILIGKLTKELINYQEEVFVEQIQNLVPSKSYLKFLKYFVQYFNRNIDKYIPEEYLEEIYGISQAADTKFSFIGSNYDRILNYHAAHDIGHALADYHMVGCTAFACWGNKSADGTLIVARNFDFYLGDKFSENKIVEFINPDKGYKFMIISWGGMIGAVSGMNENGLTVTINAAKSNIPLSSKTPITIISREILQYAKNINEAYSIASRMKSFVSESFLVGSLEDNLSVLIEKGPDKITILYPDSGLILSTNHFQSEFFNYQLADREKTTKASEKRLIRLKQLVGNYPQMNVNYASTILRDQKGIDGKNIGLGNEESINQLICHHSIIFKPSELKVWVSTFPYQIGKYKCYDLHTIFGLPYPNSKQNILTDIQADTFLTGTNFQKFIKFKKLKSDFYFFMKHDITVSYSFINAYIESNPDFYLVYLNIADYFYGKKEYLEACKFYRLTLDKEIPTYNEEKYVSNQVNKCLVNIKSKRTN